MNGIQCIAIIFLNAWKYLQKHTAADSNKQANISKSTIVLHSSLSTLFSRVINSTTIAVDTLIVNICLRFHVEHYSESNEFL